MVFKLHFAKCGTSADIHIDFLHACLQVTPVQMQLPTRSVTKDGSLIKYLNLKI